MDEILPNHWQRCFRRYKLHTRQRRPHTAHYHLSPPSNSLALRQLRIIRLQRPACARPFPLHRLGWKRLEQTSSSTLGTLMIKTPKHQSKHTRPYIIFKSVKLASTIIAGDPSSTCGDLDKSSVDSAFIEKRILMRDD